MWLLIAVFRLSKFAIVSHLTWKISHSTMAISILSLYIGVCVLGIFLISYLKFFLANFLARRAKKKEVNLYYGPLCVYIIYFTKGPMYKNFLMHLIYFYNYFFCKYLQLGVRFIKPKISCHASLPSIISCIYSPM